MATTLTQLQTRARYIADMTNSQFISDAELTYYINSGLTELYDLVVRSFEDYFINTTTFTIASGANSYALPSDFYKCRAVDFQLNGNWTTVKLFNFANRNTFRRVSFLYATPDSGRRYRIFGDNLIIQNTDNAAGNYRMYYVPAPTLLTSGSDTIPATLSQAGWDEYIALYAAERMLSKEETDNREVITRREELKQRIISLAADRQVEQSEVVSDMSQTLILTGWYEY